MHDIDRITNSHYMTVFLTFQIWSHPWHHIACQNKSIPLGMVILPCITKPHLSSLASSPTPSMSCTPAVQTKSAVLKTCSYVSEQIWTCFLSQSHSRPISSCLLLISIIILQNLAQPIGPTMELFRISPGWIAWVWNLLPYVLEPSHLLCCTITPHVHPQL